MAIIKKKTKKYDDGGSVEGPKPKKGSFEDVMGKTLNKTDVFSKNFKKSTPAEDALAAKQAAEMQKRYKAGKALKNGGKVKPKNISAGVGPKKTKKAGKVDPKGAYTKVQTRTLGKAKAGTKMSKVSKCKYGCY